MAFEKSVEAVIRKAIARGEFESLAGAGKPVDLREYFETPEQVRVTQALLKQAGIQPAEIQLMQEIARMNEMLRAEGDPLQRSRIAALRNRKQLELDVLIERNRKTTR